MERFLLRRTVSNLVLGQFCQRVQLHALVERCLRDGAEVITKGFTARGGATDGALVLARSVGGCGSEPIRWSGQIVHSSRVLVRPMLRLRVQLFVDRLAAEDSGGCFEFSSTHRAGASVNSRCFQTKESDNAAQRRAVPH